jgi:LEA14-like dessication related protein
MTKLFVGVTTFLLTSCAVVQNITFQRPELELQAIALKSLGLTGGSIELVIDVYNPNAYDVTTMRIDAGIDLEDTHFGDVTLERDIVLTAERHTVVEIPVSFTWSGVGAGARALLERGAVNYAIDSRLYVGTPLGEQTINLRRSGIAPLKEML